MIICSAKEKAPLETRVAITPSTASAYSTEGHIVLLEKNYGQKAGFTDQQYKQSGVQLIDNIKDLYSKSDIILQIAPTTADVLSTLNKNQLFIADFQNFSFSSLKQTPKILCLEKIPRTSSAQSIDILSSQSTVRGYMAALHALYHAKRLAFQIMSAAASIKQAGATVIGASLTGLQAASLLKKAGCRVTILDINQQNKDLAASVGANFILYSATKELKEILKSQDIIISAVSSTNKIIISKDIFSSLKDTCVMVDTTSHNIALTDNSKTSFYFHRNPYFERLAPLTSSELWAGNMLNLIKIISPTKNTLNLTNSNIIPMLYSIHHKKEI